MQILFISDEAQVIRFLSGLQAEARMPEGNVEVSGTSEDSLVTVICSGISTHYLGTITSIDSGYTTHVADGKWLEVKFIVRRANPGGNAWSERPVLND